MYATRCTINLLSKSASGGRVNNLTVNNKLDHFRKDDLSVIEDHCESLWIQIKNNKGKISCVVVYMEQRS